MDDLLDESKFLDFEKDLLEDLQSNRNEYKQNRVRELFKNLIEKNIGNINDGIYTLKTIKSNINDKKNEWKDEEDDFIKILDRIAKFFENNQRVLKKIKEKNEDNEDNKINYGWEINETKKDIKQSKEIDIKGMNKSALKNEIYTYIDEENKDITSKLDRKEKFNCDILNSKLDGSDDTIEKLLQTFNEKRTDIQMKSFKLEIDVNKVFPEVKIDFDDVWREVKNIWDTMCLGQLGLNEKQVKNVKEKVEKARKEKAEEAIGKFGESLESKIKGQFGEYYNDIQAKKEDVRKILEKNRENQPVQLKKSEELHQILIDFFKNNK